MKIEMQKKCQIIFVNSPEKEFYAGQLIVGKVELNLIGLSIVQHIYVQIFGTAHTYWIAETKNGSKQYGSDEDHLDERVYLVGARMDRFGKITCRMPSLVAGNYIYSFRYMLPFKLPSSFDGKNGYIKYSVRIVLESRFETETFEEGFTLIEPIAMIDTPTLQQPVSVIAKKTFQKCSMLLCFSLNLLKIVAEIPLGGYIAGQTIDLKLAVENRSNQNVSKFTVQLIQVRFL